MRSDGAGEQGVLHPGLEGRPRQPWSGQTRPPEPELDHGSQTAVQQHSLQTFT